jgi:hypothetical protein
MRNAPLLLAALAAALSTPLAMGQNLFKCVDDKGHATYSDRACAQAPRPAAPPPSPRPAPAPAGAAKASAPAAVPVAAPSVVAPAPALTKLTPAVVEGVLQRAVELGDRSDFRAQCALAAPDLNFKITDHCSSPASVYSGGRAEICSLQQQSAQAMQASGLRSSSHLSKLDIRVSADGTQATAKSESAAAISMQGQHVLTMQCTREEVLALYNGSALYKRVNAVCRPVG